MIYKLSNNKVETINEQILKEGPGAGYTIEGEIVDVKVLTIKNKTFDDGELAFELEATANLYGVEANSYYYGDKFEQKMPINISKVIFDVSPDNISNYGESEIVDNLTGLRIIAHLGSGYSFVPFNGKLDLGVYDLDSSLQVYGDNTISLVCELTDKADIDDITSAVSGNSVNDDDYLEESIKVGDNVKVLTPGNNFYNGRTGVVDYVKDDIVTVTFDDKKSPKLNNFDLNQVSKITKSGSTKESYYSYESARPNTREFLDLMDKYALDTDDILRYLIADYWSDNEVGDFLDAIKVEYDLDESLKNLDEELSDAAKSAEIVLRNKFLNEPYTDSDFRKYAFDYMYNKGISSDEQYKVINHVMSSEDDKMVDLFTDLK